MLACLRKQLRLLLVEAVPNMAHVFHRWNVARWNEAVEVYGPQSYINLLGELMRHRFYGHREGAVIGCPNN